LSDSLQQVSRLHEVGPGTPAATTAPVPTSGAALQRLGEAACAERTTMLRQSAAPIHHVLSSLLGQFGSLYWDRHIAQQSEQLLSRPDAGRREALARDYAAARPLGLSENTQNLAQKALKLKEDTPRSQPGERGKPRQPATSGAAATPRTVRQSGGTRTTTGALAKAKVQRARQQRSRFTDS
jgi:hypothetical protein